MLSVAQGKGVDAKIIKPQWNGPSQQVWDSRYARLPRHVDGRPDRCLKRKACPANSDQLGAQSFSVLSSLFL